MKIERVFGRVHATLYATWSVRWLVGWSIGRAFAFSAFPERFAPAQSLATTSAVYPGLVKLPIETIVGPMNDIF